MALTACGDRGGEREREARSGTSTTVCGPPVPSGDTSQLPPEFPELPSFGVVTDVAVESGFVHAKVVSTAQLADLYERIRRLVPEHGFTVTKDETEGFEAEVEFRRGPPEEGGTYKLLEGPCRGQVTVSLVYTNERYR